jgi:hypothetical protein
MSSNGKVRHDERSHMNAGPVFQPKFTEIMIRGKSKQHSPGSLDNEH